MFRHTAPAWSDANLASLTRHVRSRLFLSHVRAANVGEATTLNCLTALDVSAGRIPIHYESDKEVIGAALSTLGLTPANRSRLVRIRDTGHLEEFWCSEALYDEVNAHKHLSQLGEPEEMEFDGQGMLQGNVS